MTDRYAVIGNPIAHSKSPLIHGMFARQTGQDISYEAIMAPLDGFSSTIAQLRAAGYRGCNITVPFKFEAYALATELTPRARAAQAVNTLRFDGDTILGDNTDGAGLVRDIEHNIGVLLQKKRVLLMGAGGASFGVVLPLLATYAQLTVVNRTVSKAQQLAATFAAHAHIAGLGYNDLQGQHYDVVINATSSGLSDELAPLPDDVFARPALAYDMMYGRDTPFLKFARERGAQTADGLGMLVEQAAEAFYLWRGVRPDTAVVLTTLRSTL